MLHSSSGLSDEVRVGSCGVVGRHIPPLQRGWNVCHAVTEPQYTDNHLPNRYILAGRAGLGRITHGSLIDISLSERTGRLRLPVAVLLP